MSGLGQVGIIAVQASLPRGSRSAPPAGQPLQGRVVATPDGTAVQAGRLRIPLPAGAGLTSGQAVEATLVETPDGPQWNIRLATPPPPGAASPGTLPSPHPLASLFPGALPHSESLERLMNTLFAPRRPFGGDLLQVVATLNRAVAAGVLPPELVDELARFAGRLDASGNEDFEALLKELAARARLSTEARFAKSPGQGLAPDDIRGRLMQLRDFRPLVDFLGRDAGKFRDTLDRVVDRLAGGHVQNRPGQNQAYLFLDVPFPPDAPILAARVHFFGDGRRDDGGEESGWSSVALDIETVGLDNLWITLRAGHGLCDCLVRAASPEAAALIEDRSGELAEALRALGFARAQVHVQRWDGDRLRETADLMRPFAGLQAEA